MGSSPDRLDGERDQSEIIVDRRKKFRQAVNLAEIFFLINKNRQSHWDPETQRVLFAERSMPEDMPAALTHLIDPEKAELEQEKWKNREREIINSSETWIGILPDKNIEIVIFSERYDQGYVSPTLGVDEFADSLPRIKCQIEQTQQIIQEDPVGYEVGKITRSTKTVLERTYRRRVLDKSLKRTELEERREEYDYQGNTIESLSSSQSFSSESKESDDAIWHVRFNMFSELQYRLGKAIESENTDLYKADFSLEARQKVLDFVLSEIKLKQRGNPDTDFGRKPAIYGSGRFIDETYFPMLELLVPQTNTQDGVITSSFARISTPLVGSFIDSGKATFSSVSASMKISQMLEMNNQIREYVDEWEKSQKKSLGEEGLENLISEQANHLITQLKSNTGQVRGRVHHLEIEPRTGKYTFESTSRLLQGELYNDTSSVQFNQLHENPDNPSCEELRALLSLAI